MKKMYFLVAINFLLIIGVATAWYMSHTELIDYYAENKSAISDQTGRITELTERFDEYEENFGEFRTDYYEDRNTVNGGIVDLYDHVGEQWFATQGIRLSDDLRLSFLFPASSYTQEPGGINVFNGFHDVQLGQIIVQIVELPVESGLSVEGISDCEQTSNHEKVVYSGHEFCLEIAGGEFGAVYKYYLIPEDSKNLEYIYSFNFVFPVAKVCYIDDEAGINSEDSECRARYTNQLDDLAELVLNSLEFYK